MIKVKVQKKGAKETEENPGLVHRTVWCATGLSGVPPDSVRCTKEPDFKLATFGNSGSRSAIIHRTVRCASRVTATQRQRSSTRTLNALQCAPAHAEVKTGARRRTGQ